MNNSYTRKEIESLGDVFPSKGDYCEKCKTFIPKFAELSEEDEAHCRKTEKSKGSAAGMKMLTQFTGCSVRWAKIWSLHPNGPTPILSGPPCPYCGEALRTEKAKQCAHCFKSWHNNEL